MNFFKKKSEKTETTPISEETPKLSFEESLSNLTNKNSDYLHDVRRQLAQSGKSEEEIKAILTEILPQILNAQKNGMLARQLLGTPTEFSAQYKPKAGEKTKKETNKNPYLMFLDSFLLFFAFFSGIYGVMTEFQKGTVPYGLTTILLSSATAALAMNAYYRAQSKIVGKKSGEKQSLWQRLKPAIQMIAFMIVWITVTTFSAFLRGNLNPVLDGVTLLVLAAIAFGIRFLVKRHYNIQSALVSRYTMENDKK